MDSLPPELILNILSYLPQHDLLLRIRNVSKYWNQLAHAPRLWYKLDVRRSEETTSLYLENIDLLCVHIKHLLTDEEFLVKVCYHRTPKPHFKNLRNLDLSSVYLATTSVITDFISECTNLESISVRFDDSILFRDIFKTLSKLNLKDLHINYSGDDVEFLFILEELSRNKYSKTLSIHCNTIQNNTVRFLLENFQNLKSLDVTSSYLKNDTFMSMQRLLSLNALSLDYTRVNDAGLKLIARNVPNLKFFSVVRCEDISDEGIVNIAENCPFLEQIHICRSYTISGSTLVAIAKGCPRLQRLSVMACAQMDDAGVESLVMKCKHLQVLILNFCIQLTDQSLFSISRFCTTLRKLDISNNGKFTSKGISSLLQSCKLLELLNSASCGGITDLRFPVSRTGIKLSNKSFDNEDTILAKLVTVNERATNDNSYSISNHQHCHIRSMNLSHTSINNISVLELSFLCPDLRNLYLFGCKNVTIDIVECLFNNCVFMEKISVKRKTIFRKNIFLHAVS
ncbi:F-box/LRR-repeat protein 2-like [Mytilus trossulus]|uniref:F-box/LRR-repeat protein 2-like n=1 Tax=Mytilus trossulus TaxID=6551 RepID=UPI0030044533